MQKGWGGDPETTFLAGAQGILRRACQNSHIEKQGFRERTVIGRMHLESHARGSPGGSVAKRPRSQCRGPKFDPWLGN